MKPLESSWGLILVSRGVPRHYSCRWSQAGARLVHLIANHNKKIRFKNISKQNAIINYLFSIFHSNCNSKESPSSIKFHRVSNYQIISTALKNYSWSCTKRVISLWKIFSRWIKRSWSIIILNWWRCSLIVK